VQDRLRPLFYHLFVAGIIGGLWAYADARRYVGEGEGLIRLPPADPTTIRRIVQAGPSDCPAGGASPVLLQDPAAAPRPAPVETSIADPGLVLP
jgi:hypothetical protein